MKDKSNSALILCNMASSKKLIAGRLPLKGRHELWRPSEMVRDSAVPVMDLVESLLSEAIGDCSASMESLGEREVDPKVWDLIASELGMAYLTLGVRRRQSLLNNETSITPSANTHISSGAATKVAEPLDKAAKIYETLGDGHQLAAARYQAGTLYSRIWTRASEPRKARERLALVSNCCVDSVISCTAMSISLMYIDCVSILRFLFN